MLGDMTWDELETLEGVQGLRQFCANQKKKFTVSIEGNVGCGKSTLIKYFESCPTVECLPEPVDKWTNLKGHNALQLLYQDPARWCFSFNNYALLTRMEMHKHKSAKPVKMLERSLYSTRYVFVENSRKEEILSSLEHAVLDELFQELITDEGTHVDLFVYLRAPASVCYERLRMRNRMEEAGVPFEFINDLHTFHEDWLIHHKYPVPAPVLILDASQELPLMKQIYEEYKTEILCGCA